LINGSEGEASTQWTLTPQIVELKKDLVAKFHGQVNCGLAGKKHELLEAFYRQNAESLVENLNKLLQN